MTEAPPHTATLDEAPARPARGAPAPTAPLADLPVGEPARYAEAVEHGRGGRGRVLRARDTVLDRTVAIKELLDPSDRAGAARMVREALVTARLQHPAIVPVYEAGRRPTGEPFYVMKLVEGRSLHDEAAARAGLSDRLALLTNVIAAAEAVGYAHQHGIIHRDLKPSNVVVGAFGETVVIDWGLAKDLRGGGHDGRGDGPDMAGLYDVAAADLTSAGAVLGTPAFMPPEQARGEATDARADVYALGAVLYYVLAGRPPYQATTARGALAMVVAAPPRPLRAREPGVPRELAAIVAKAMARDPAARYPNAKALAEDLERFRTGQLVRAQAYSAPMRLRRWLARHRTAVAAALAVAAAGAGFAARARVVRARQVARHVAEADAALAGLGRRREALAAARAGALGRFDAGDFDGGNLAWDDARALASAADKAYADAARALEAALVIDPLREPLRARFADLLYERAALAGETFRADVRDELLARLAAHDDGTYAARLAAPGRLRVTARPAGARVRVAPLGGAPDPAAGAALERTLPPGTYVLDADAPRHAPSRLVVSLAPGAAREVEIALAPEGRVPEGFAHVAAGAFVFGSDDHDVVRRQLNAAPLHEVATGAYLVARREVTFAEWISFLEALSPDERARRSPAASDRGHELRLARGPDGAYTLRLAGAAGVASAREGESLSWPRRRRATQDWRRLPVAAVSLDDAEAYAAWLDATGRVPGAHVCSELEWERAARGADARRFPHGDRLEPDDANFDETYDREPGAFGPDEVGAHPASRSPYGVDDLAGNVWEWVRALDGRPLIRGGGWYTNSISARVENRELAESHQRDPIVGVRLCAKIDPLHSVYATPLSAPTPAAPLTAPGADRAVRTHPRRPVPPNDMTLAPRTPFALALAPFALAALAGLAACAAPTDPDAEGAAPPESVDETFRPLISEREVDGYHSQQGTNFYGETPFSIDGKAYRLEGFDAERIVIPGREALAGPSWRTGGIAGTSVMATSTGGARSANPCPSGSARGDRTRDCGWRNLGASTCTAGERVEVWREPTCQPGQASCVDDSFVLRVCRGTASCDHAASLGPLAGSTCATGRCPKIAFACPPAGRYTVMIPRDHDMAGETFRSRSPAAASARAFPPARAEGGASLAGARLKASVVEANGAGRRELEARIKRVLAPREAIDPQGRDVTRSTWLYDVEIDVPTPSGVQTRPLCAPSGLADPDDPDNAVRQRAAVALDATWDAKGATKRTELFDEFARNPRFAFACLGGAVGKCYKWGYRPWDRVGNDEATNRDRLQACVRMARADYCGDGDSYTYDGTQIAHWDDRTADPTLAPDVSTPVGDLKFEAGWTSNGAVCLSHLRWESLGIAPGTVYSDASRTPLCKTWRQGGIWQASPDQEFAVMPRVCNDATEANAHLEQQSLARAPLFNRSRQGQWKPLTPVFQPPPGGWPLPFPLPLPLPLPPFGG